MAGPRKVGLGIASKAGAPRPTGTIGGTKPGRTVGLGIASAAGAPRPTGTVGGSAKPGRSVGLGISGSPRPTGTVGGGTGFTSTSRPEGRGTAGTSSRPTGRGVVSAFGGGGSAKAAVDRPGKPYKGDARKPKKRAKRPNDYGRGL